MSFIPVIKVILLVYEDYGLKASMKYVIFTFEVGKGWLLTLFVSIILLAYMKLAALKDVAYYAVGIIFIILLLIAQGWSSHAGTISVAGFATHSFHFLAVTIWVGVIVVASFFSQNKENWLRFLNWFTPLAIVCLITIIISGLSGLILMKFLIDYNEYTWLLPYGQVILI
ncbi:hypothetical protein ACOI1C_00255 [Bacillus sp. DJP31]|uniref:hypothetical protein n=1 Tax=Bacillus sp. DJP31 TaxID=3409789 RepID=UPI003BB4DD7E